jgi:hypothetical protein
MSVSDSFWSNYQDAFNEQQKILAVYGDFCNKFPEYIRSDKNRDALVAEFAKRHEVNPGFEWTVDNIRAVVLDLIKSGQIAVAPRVLLNLPQESEPSQEQPPVLVLDDRDFTVGGRVNFARRDAIEAENARRTVKFENDMKLYNERQQVRASQRRPVPSESELPELPTLALMENESEELRIVQLCRFPDKIRKHMQRKSAELARRAQGGK